MMLPSTCSSSMHRSTNLLLTLIVISITPSSKVVHALALQPQVVHAHGGGCIPAERAALLSFHKGITSDRTHVLASWHGQDCCRWRGVSCSNRTGHVIKLQLRHTIQYPYIYGYYYDACCDANSLFGEISASLLSLKHLEHLDLSMNCLLGPNSHIPRFLGFMDNLRYLNLSGMPFIGRVPPQLGNLSKLHHLHLGKGHPGSDGPVSGSYSIGRMYSTDITWLTELPLLEYLSMSGINLSRIVDWPHTLNMIPSLTVISLAGCSLDTASQSLPYLNLTKLEKLDLSLNNLGHSIASSWFWKVTSLRHLSLRGNQLFGNFPDALGNMTTLKVLDLSANNLNKTGNFKNVLKNLCCLEILDLSQNYMNGDIVTMIEGLPRCAREKLLELHFGENRFPGTLPNFIGEFSSLNMLDVSSDNLVGPMPPGLWNLMHLIILDLSWNQLNCNVPTEIGALAALTSLDISASNLTGNIPASLGKLKNLVTLSLSENNLTGSIPPEVMHSTSLITLDLSNNNLNGSIPAGLGKLKHLVTLSLAYNMITGPIPPEAMHPTSLITLDLSLNHLNGSIPAELGKLKRLATLYLRENKITGPIPREVMHSTSLITLDLSNNHISGSIPDELGKSKHLATLNLRDNNTAGPIPPEVMHSASLTTLDLSGNLLNGSIPARLGKLKHLVTLDLTDNNLTGSIPREVMHLTSLTSLDLSSNHLYGSVPTELGSLKDLVSLDLSNNSLSGVITEEHFANLKSLDVIYLCSNNLKIVVDPDWRSPFRLGAANFASCQMGPLFPAWLQQPPGINSLNISSNSVKDKVPDWFWYTLSEASYLDISNNQISGSLPAHLGSMFFEELHLSSNQLTGSIPSFLGNITMLDISNNNFSGVIPSNFEASQLQMLLIYSNRVGGYIPESLCKLQQLVYLDLSNNFLEGEIPQCFEMQQMQYLLLGNNSLSGKFPAFLQSNTDLKFLDLAWNKLSGSLPTWIGDLGKLSFVLLDHNAFSDNIPVDITRLRNLQYLDLSANNFSGAIPCHLSNLTLMTKVQKKFMDMGDVSTGIIDTGGLI